MTSYLVKKIRTQECPDCYLCGSAGELIYQKLEDSLFGVPGYWGFRKCSNTGCGLIWSDPMPVAADICKLYEAYYTHNTNTHEAAGLLRSFGRQLKNSILSITYKYSARKEGRMISIIGYILSKSQFIRDRIGRGIMWLDASQRGHLLDIGCGNGNYLEVMRNLGWEVQGMEPDQNAAKVGCERYGLDIKTGHINEVEFQENSFDVVTLNHVIEHLHDPSETLDVLHSLLKKGGCIVIVTPNTESLGHKFFKKDWRGLEAPRHLFLYSAKNIESLLTKAGFNVDVVRTYAGGAESMFARSMAIRYRQRHIGENPNDAYGKYYKISSKIFLMIEYILSKSPFRKRVGEELLAIAVKK